MSMPSSTSTFFVFFHAEDGIRAPLVTGVQTCALPIFCQVAFHDEIAGIYHEWDAPGRKIADGTAPAANADAYDRAEPSATRAAASDPAPGTIPHPRLDRRPHHRDQQQLLRIARGLDPAGWADQATPSGRSEAADAP